MKIDLVLSFVALALPLILSRYLMDKALRNLTSEEKLRLIDAVSKRNNSLRLLLIFGFALIFFLGQMYFPHYFTEITVIFVSAFLLYVFVAIYFGYQRLRPISLPAQYMKSFFISSALSLIGFVAFFGLILYGYFSRGVY